jgi:hypothetical protein
LGFLDLKIKLRKSEVAAQDKDKGGVAIAK